uniref:Uncharacterized protein n=1 Tax=Setaria viridis TaxID=4556 RepID=A0A4U6UI83_SETVI|nr:hypothetical protein SEVIR_5G183600v2 [Setaria viridis]
MGLAVVVVADKRPASTLRCAAVRLPSMPRCAAQPAPTPTLSCASWPAPAPAPAPTHPCHTRPWFHNVKLPSHTAPPAAATNPYVAASSPSLHPSPCVASHRAPPCAASRRRPTLRRRRFASRRRSSPSLRCYPLPSHPAPQPRPQLSLPALTPPIPAMPPRRAASRIRPSWRRQPRRQLSLPA